MHPRLETFPLLALAAAFAMLQPAAAQTVYSNTFESGIAGSEWSHATIATTPRGARKFLGRFNAETVILSLPNLPVHSAVTVTFDLFFIQSWDGSDPTFGPDLWDWKIPGERSLVHATFSNTTNGAQPQSYPGIYPIDSFTALTGAAERGTLGYAPIIAFPGVTDSVYRMAASFAHQSDSLTLEFAGAPWEPIENESWGIDNITVAISNPPAGVIEFSAPVFYANESETAATITARRTGNTSASATVKFAATGGTAASGVEYSLAAGSLTFDPGEAEASFSIELFDDATQEPRNDTVVITLSDPSIEAALGHPSTATLVVVDNDSSEPHFAKIFAPPISYEGGDSIAAAWGDFDGDGRHDLLVPNTAGQPAFLYRNVGGKDFSKVTAGIVTAEAGNASGAAWADADNDGDLDLYIARFGGNSFYRNDGTGNFTKITSGAIGAATPDSVGCAWGDYDNDGNVDLFVTTQSGPNLLFHNSGDGTFTRVTTGAIATDAASSTGCAWADYDNDGHLDLFVANAGGARNFLYHNNRNGAFTRVSAAPFTTDAAESYNCAWGDYNNDGFLDLFVSNFGTQNFLYRNNGNGAFTKVTTGAIATDAEYNLACGWADYDNDGDLDIFVTTFGATSSLYSNNSNATFSKRTLNEIVRDYNPSGGMGWCDFDEDGDMDLFIAKYFHQNNALYENRGTTNNYLTVRLRGTLSNRAAIGARVRVKARLNNNDVWQHREISGGTGSSQDAMEANFGLGAATNIDALQITWPSGAIQNWTNLSANKIFTIVESPQLRAALPPGTLTISAKASARIKIETSPDLRSWTSLLDTNAPNSEFSYSDSTASFSASRYYRAMYLR